MCSPRRRMLFLYWPSGVVQKSLQKVREGPSRRKQERENEQSWCESWFQRSPWLTTLVSTLLGPFIVLLLTLMIGPCILNRLMYFIKECLNTIQIMVMRQQYQMVAQDEEKDSSTETKRQGGMWGCHDRQPRLGVGRVTWLSGHLKPANQHAPSKKKGTYQGKVEKPAKAQVWKKPRRFRPVRLLCKHVTNPLKPATNCLCTPYKLGNSLGSVLSDPVPLRWTRGGSPESS